MITKSTVRTLAAATMLLPLVLQAQETNKWSFEVAPFVWVASTSAEMSVPQIASGIASSLPVASGVPSSVQQFDTRISGGLEFDAQVRYEAFGVLGEFNWLQLNTESANPGRLYSNLDLRSDYIYSKAALTYDLPLKGKFHAEVLAGAGIQNLHTHLKIDSGLASTFYSDHDETSVIPLIGANLRYDLTKHWMLLTRGTVGGFESSNLQFDVFAGVGYQFTRWCAVTLGYRYFEQDYTRNNFTFNLDAHGGLLGVGFRF